MIDVAVRAALLTMGPVTTLVGTRVYTKQLPQTPVLPAVVVHRIVETETAHLRGPDDLIRGRVQVDSIGRTAAEVEALDAAVHGNGLTTGLRTFRGVAGTVYVSVLLPSGVRDSYTGEEIRQWKVMRDYVAYFKP